MRPWGAHILCLCWCNDFVTYKTSTAGCGPLCPSYAKHHCRIPFVGTFHGASLQVEHCFMVPKMHDNKKIVEFLSHPSHHSGTSLYIKQIHGWDRCKTSHPHLTHISPSVFQPIPYHEVYGPVSGISFMDEPKNAFWASESILIGKLCRFALL